MEEVEYHPPEIIHPLTTPDQEFDAGFRPTGAIAFFVILIILALLIWFGIYFLMLERN